jgi:phosphoglycolate phosphatase
VIEADAVIFDLDGVIVDSYAAVTDSINGALAAHGLPTRPAQALRHFIGPPTFVAFAELTGEPPDSAVVAAIVASYRARYAAVYLEQTVVIDGVREMLATIAERLPLAIATSKSVTFTQPLLAALGLDGLFAFVAAAGPVDTDDDKTAIVGRALAALGSPRATMVGDRSFDIEAAHAHALPAIGVTWGIGSADELRSAGADALVARPEELVALLAGAETL